MKKLITVIIFFSFSVILYSQVDSTNLQQNYESMLEDAIEGKESSEVFDVLEFLSQNKIPLNTASINDLLQIPFLDRTAATSIIRHRNVLGGIYNVDQLRFIESVNFELIEKILPFIKLGDEQPVTFNEIFDKNFQLLNLSFRSRALLDLQKEEGYKDGTFPDSRWKLYNRLIISKANKIRAGVLIEKDPGEKQLSDFSTFHLQFKNLDFIDNLIIGDYLFEFGQGLALWSRYSFSKGSDAISVLPRTGRGLVPYLSSDENQFMRGISASAKYNGFVISGFFSSRFLDANVDSTTNQITSLPIDGLHRTINEISKKDKITERMIGVSASYSFGDIGNVSALLYNTKDGNDFEEQSIVQPGGNSFTYFSTGYNFAYEKVSVTGETAFSNKSFATLNSAEFLLNKNFSFLVSYRHYGEEYWNLHSSGFGERDFAQNETGFFTGVKYKSFFGTINFYYDQFRFNYVSDKFRFPANGYDFMIYYTFNPFRGTEVRLRYKNEKKEIAEQVSDVYGLVDSRRQNIRGDFSYVLSKQIQLHSRIEFVSATPALSKDYGSMVFQDFKYTPLAELVLSARIVFFRTDSYNSRIYEYENDMPGVMTSPALFGDGMRWYLVARYNTPYGLSFTMKYSELVKPSEKYLGTGSSMIQGSLDNRFGIQMDYQF